MSLAQAAREQQQCRSQAFWCAQTLRAERIALGICMLKKFFKNPYACDLDHQALGCAYGDKTRGVLEQTILWKLAAWAQQQGDTR
jgi:hypothetical protein